MKDEGKIWVVVDRSGYTISHHRTKRHAARRAAREAAGSTYYKLDQPYVREESAGAYDGKRRKRSR